VDRQHEHADQIRLRGSVGLATDASGAKITDSDTRYSPYGVTRPGLAGTGLPTDRRFTGQREEASLGCYDYGARPYAPALGRFLQADTLVPGAARGSGGGAATLGYDARTRLTPLTVNLGEFVGQVNAENRELLQFGPFFQWDSHTRQAHPLPMGPANPQALNRYAYCLNNSLKYTDPQGHVVTLAVVGIFALAGAVGSGIGYIAAQAALGKPIDTTELGVTVGVGAVAGALAPIASLGILVGIGAAANIANEVLPSLIKGEPVDPVKTAAAGGIGAIFGLAGGVLGGNSSAVTEYVEELAIQPLREAIGPSSAAMGKSMINNAFREMALEGVREGGRTAFWDFYSDVDVDTLLMLIGRPEYQ